MTLILAPRSLPSVEEMNIEWNNFVAAEVSKKLAAMESIIKAGWIVRNSKAEAEKRSADFLKWRKKNACDWGRRVRGSYRGIMRLKPIIFTWEDDEKLMNIHNKMFSELNEVFRWRAEQIRTKMMLAKADKLRKQAFKERDIKKRGMNKKSEAHVARATGSLVLKGMDSAAEKAAITAVNFEKKLRKDKEKAEWILKNKIAQAKALLEPKSNIVVINYDIESDNDDSDIKSVKNDEEKEKEEKEKEDIKNAEDQALEDLKRMTITIIEAREIREALENEEIKKEVEEKAQSELEEAHFISTMSKAMGLEEKKCQSITKDTKVKKPVIELGFLGLISQKRLQRCSDDSKYAKRSEAFSDLADKKKLDDVLTNTTLCRSVTDKKKCYHIDCRFAHSIEQLKPRECRFGNSCGFVKNMENGRYINNKFGKTGKKCSALHPGEHQRSLCDRLGLKYEEKKTSVNQPLVVATEQKHIPRAWIQHKTEDTKREYTDNKIETIIPITTTMTWSTVVFKSLTDEEKKNAYGKGLEIITKQGYVDGSGLGKNTNGIVNPVSQSEIRQPLQRHGIGYLSTSVYVKSPSVSVTSKGFSWVKGAVLNHQKKSRISRWDVKPAYLTAIESINQKLSSTVIDEKLINFSIDKAIDKAIAKAAEINKRLLDEAEKSTWTQVGSESKKYTRPVQEKSDEIIFRVPKKDAELALLAAIRSGISNFRIEFSDSK